MSDKGKGRRLLSIGGGSSDAGKLLPPSIVTPVLRDVGKLAASVAAVNTNSNLDNNSGNKDKNSEGSGSATGNPRNKCVLEPGHSLMDWIRLGNSGKDLTGVGALAGKMIVTPEEMRLHNKRDDAWIAIRGNVYNVTEYLSFHPGGVAELMKGVGVADATALFDNIHPWVNYDKMLTKCYVGRLGNTTQDLSKAADFANVRFASPRGSEKTLAEQQTNNRRYSIAINDDRHVRYDWIQKHDLFILYFYTGPYSNPYFEVRRPFDHKWTFVITFVESVFTFRFIPYDILEWPPKFKVFYETGKIEVGFEKRTKKTWPTCGLVEQCKRRVLAQQCKTKYMIQEHVMINKYTYMISVQKTDLSICNTPLGYHIMFYNDSKDAREYTPIPHLYIKSDSAQLKETFTSPFITFLIRRYPDGRMSSYLFNKKVGDIFLGSEPMGILDLQLISDKEHFIFLAGGVGVTPFLGIIHFLLEKKVKPIRKILLVVYNKTVEHQFLEDKLQSLTHDNRFHYLSVVTRPDDDFAGLSGHVTLPSLKEFCRRYFSPIPIQDIFYFVCGPLAFNSSCHEVISATKADPTNSYYFATESVPMSQEQVITKTSVVENPTSEDPLVFEKAYRERHISQEEHDVKKYRISKSEERRKSKEEERRKSKEEGRRKSREEGRQKSREKSVDQLRKFIRKESALREARPKIEKPHINNENQLNKPKNEALSVKKEEQRAVQLYTNEENTLHRESICFLCFCIPIRLSYFIYLKRAIIEFIFPGKRSSNNSSKS